MFSLDVSEINNALGDDFDGVKIGEEAGIWFHQSAGSDFEYGDDGSITNYAFDNQMFLDRGNDLTRDLEAINCAEGGRTTRNGLDLCSFTQIADGSVTSSSGAGTSSGGGSVPAPGGLALILVGLAGLGRKFRNSKA